MAALRARDWSCDGPARAMWPNKRSRLAPMRRMAYLLTYSLVGCWQVLNLMHTPLAVITKAAAVLSDDVFTDMMPVAWELLIETDQELAAAAGNLSLNIFVLQCV